MKISSLHIFFLVFLSILSDEPLLFFYAGALLLYILKIFWRSNESKHLLVNLLLYWAVVAILIPYAELTNKPLNDLVRYGKSNIRLASWIGLFALTAYLLGIQIQIKNIKRVDEESLFTLLRGYDSNKIL